MINKNFIHTDPVREYNTNLFHRLSEGMNNYLMDALSEIADGEGTVEERKDLCLQFMQNVIASTADEIEMTYTLDVSTRPVDSTLQEALFHHHIRYNPTEDFLEGRTDRYPVMKRGPDIPYIRV